MKKIFLISGLFILSVTMGFAQKFAYVDTEYILDNIPEFLDAQEELNSISAKWQKEIETMKTEIDKMYKDYQAERVLLTDDMRTKREDQIIKKEKEMKDLQRKYFAPEGLLSKKRQELVKPIQDDVFNAIKQLATEGNYAVIFDVASGPVMLFTDPKYDKSDNVLEKMGIKN